MFRVYTGLHWFNKGSQFPVDREQRGAMSTFTKRNYGDPFEIQAAEAFRFL